MRATSLLQCSSLSLLMTVPLMTLGLGTDQSAAAEEGTLPALALDEQCTGAVSIDECALSALQYRGQKSGSSGSCSAYGCNEGYKPSNSCQCNSKCTKYKNCCADYQPKCVSCSAYGCSGGYKPGNSCQCNSKCPEYKNCCADYQPKCVHHAGGGSCLAYGCTGYDPKKSCQCNSKCTKYNDCCTDYQSKCVHHTEGGSCLAYGCSDYDPKRSCQCNSKCGHYGNCCSDYASQCAQGAQDGSHRIYGHPETGKPYPNRPGFTLKLVEEFNYPLNLDNDLIWTWSDGGLQESQTRFVKEQIMFVDGKMIIEMADRPPQHAKSCSHAEKKLIPLNKSKVSGEIRTKYNMFRYGYYEVRMKAPYVQPGNPYENGNFVSTMFIFRDGKFKHWREIDIEVTGDTKGQVSSNLIVAEDRVEWSEDMENANITQVAFNTRKDFHTYAFEWLPNRVRWFTDGKLIREHHGVIPEKSGKIMMNFWMFDKRALFGGKKIWNDVFPMHNEYDWFRFYKWDLDREYPCSDMGTDCLTEDDWYLTSNNPCDGIQQRGTIRGKEVCTATCD